MVDFSLVLYIPATAIPMLATLRANQYTLSKGQILVEKPMITQSIMS